MKKFTTTFFLLMAIVLLLPTEARAADYYLIGDFNKWATDDTSYKFTISGNTATATISASAFSSNGSDNDGVYFAVNAIESESTRWYIKPQSNSDVILGNSYDISSTYNTNNTSLCLKNPSTSSTETYTITLSFTDDINNSTLTITKSDSDSGGGETGSGEDLTDFEQGSSSNGKSYYLVSEGYGKGSALDNIFAETTTAVLNGGVVHYNRILKFTDNRDGSYSLNIPATITGKVYIEEVSYDGTVTEYRPTENYVINSTQPAKSGSISGYLETGDTYLWSMTDRGDDLNDGGIYAITIRLNKKGVPGAWTFTDNPDRRVAYFLSTAENSSAYPVYDKIATGGNRRFDNKYVGTNYFSPTAYYYVISNVVKLDDNCIEAANKFSFDGSVKRNGDATPTINKLFLLGNGDQNFKENYPDNISDEEKHKKANEFSPGELPMHPTTKIEGLAKVEYNPSNGYTTDNIKTTYSSRLGIRGQILTLDGGSGLGDGEEESMTIIGPLFSASVNENETWNWKYEAPQRSDKKTNNVMTYNETEHCYMITIVTEDEQQGAHFRFVRNANTLNSAKQWGEEESIDDNPCVHARIPYYDTEKFGHAATVSDPNEVNINSLSTTEYSEDNNKKNTNDDILFNRPAGEWTIRFYVTTDDNGNINGGYYTINSKENITQEVPVVTVGSEKMIIRTFSYGADLKPLDEKVHIYVAHEFNQDDEKEVHTGTITGTVNLYEINYVPAGEGVVLLYTGEAGDDNNVILNFTLADEYNVDSYKESLTDKKYLWTYYAKHSSEGWNNDLVGTLQDTYVFRNDYDAEKKISARNFAMNLYSNTNTGKANNVQADSKENYLGFFRFTGTSKANYAYLKYTTDDLNGDAQLLHKYLESEDETANQTTQNSRMAIIFEGINDDDLGSVTGIKELEKEKKSGDAYYYNLQGIRISVPTRGNIYIHNGKKVIVK